jgi:hypothetical protein
MDSLSRNALINVSKINKNNWRKNAINTLPVVIFRTLKVA